MKRNKPNKRKSNTKSRSATRNRGVKPTDRTKVLVIPGPYGLREVVVSDSETASTIAAYSNAVQKYLRTGDASTLMLFSRVSLMDADGEPIDLLTDLATLRRLGSAGVLSFESLYVRMN